MISYPLLPPATPAPRAFKLAKVSVVADLVSPYTGETQVQEWPGEWWELEFSLPPMLRNSAAAWQAWDAALRGKLGSFVMGDPSARTPRGLGLQQYPGWQPNTGIGLAGSKTLPTRGWMGSRAGILLAGDYLQICPNQATAPQDISNPAWQKSAGGGAALPTTPNATTITFPATSATQYALVQQIMAPLYSGREFRFTVQLYATTGTPQVAISFGLPIAGGDVVSQLLTLSTTPTWYTVTGVYSGAPAQLAMSISNPASQPGKTVRVNWMTFWSPYYNPYLHQVLTDTASDSSGNGLATFDIFPRLRIAIPDASPILTVSPKGEFRLSENRREFSVDVMKVYTMSFKAREVL